MGAEFVRFVVPTWVHRASQRPIGVLGAAYDLLKQDKVSDELRGELQRSIRWFEEHLAAPERFNASAI
jgi:hypothetical protein